MSKHAGSGFKLVVCFALIGLIGWIPKTSFAALLSAEEERLQNEQKWKEEDDLLLASANNALTSGLSLLIIPALGTDVLKEEEVQLYSSDINWQSVSDPTIAFNSSGKMKGRWSFWMDGLSYQVIIVDPGTYKLLSSTYRAKEQTTSGMPANRSLRGSGIGKLTLSETKGYVWKRVTRWEDPKVMTDTVTRSYCTLVHASGTCLSWANQEEEVPRQLSAGGYRDSKESVEVSAVDVTASPSKAFATIEIGRGEVVLSDTFIVKAPNVDFYDDDCMRVASDKVQCVMKSFELQLLRLDPSRLKPGAPMRSEWPGLRSLLAKSKYRPLSIFATKGWSDPRWGENYYIK